MLENFDCIWCSRFVFVIVLLQQTTNKITEPNRIVKRTMDGGSKYFYVFIASPLKYCVLSDSHSISSLCVCEVINQPVE